MTKFIVCFSSAVLLCGGLAFALQKAQRQDEPRNLATTTGEDAAQSTPCADCQGAPRTVEDTHVCPKFRYMFHGSYCSFYAILCPSGAPISYATDCNSDTSGHCGNLGPCMPRYTKDDAQKTRPQWAIKHEHGHGVSDPLSKGLKAFPNKLEVDPKHATVLGDRQYVEFPRTEISGSGSKRAFAELVLVQIKVTGEVFGTGNEIEKVPKGQTATKLTADQVVANGSGCNVLKIGSTAYQVIAVDKP